MTTTEAVSVPSTEARTGSSRPSSARRLAVAAAALLTCAVPVVFTVSITRMLVTGLDSDHRFHQLTGQGLLLLALWLGAVLPLVRAGWRNERPSTAAGHRHLVFVGTGAVCAAAAPGGGAPALVGVIAVGGALLWAALPLRPRLRGTLELHPVLVPVALLVTAVLAPYALDQLGLQNGATTGYHSENPHYFDMAWMASVVLVFALAGSLVRELRGLFGWVSGVCIATGAAGLLLGESRPWSSAVLAVGLAALAARVLDTRRHRA